MDRKQQLNALHSLEIIKEIFDGANIRYWLDFGTLLCAYRDGDLEHEHDIDVGVFVKNHQQICVLEEILKERLGCFDSFSFAEGRNPFEHSWGQDDVVHGDVLYWYPIGDYMTCLGIHLPISVPGYFFNSFSTLNFRKLSDTKFTIPERIEEYLEWHFGANWRVPMSFDEWTKYQQGVLDGIEEPYPKYRPIPEVLEWRVKLKSGELDGCAYWQDMEPTTKQIRAFVIKAYFECLGRAPENKGLEHYTSLIVNNEMGKDALHGILCSSAEYKQK